MKYLNKKSVAQFEERLKQLTIEHQPKWGKMDAAQMLEHLNRALENSMGEFEVKDSGNFFFKHIAKWGVLYAPVSFPKNSPTAREYRISDPVDFEKSASQFKENITKIADRPFDSHWSHHPLFGKMSGKQWKRLVWLHVDYHFKQFAV